MNKIPLGYDKTKSFKERLDDVEAVISDIAEDNINFKSETDIKVNGVSSQLNDMTKQSVAYGEIKMPSDFISLPCKFYRDFDGQIKHNMDFSQYKGGTKIYCDKNNGNDTTGDGSFNNPYKLLKKAITVAASGADSKYEIRCKSYRFDKNDCPEGATISGKTIAIIPDDATQRVMMTNHSFALSWSADENVWKTTRSVCFEVFDIRQKDIYGIPIPMKAAADLVTCKATPNTWYTDNVSVWVNTSDGLIPTDGNFIIGASQDILAPTLTNGSKLYTENCDLYGCAHNNNINHIKGDITGATTQGEFVANNCKFAGGSSRGIDAKTSNACATLNIKNTYLFNCIAAYGALDGFNNHFGNIPSDYRRNCLVLNYKCISYNHGLLDNSTPSNNAFTSHEGVNVLRIGCIGYTTKGPVLADVDGCYSISIDCHIRDSIGSGTSYKVAYKFADDITPKGKAILINCDAGGDNIYDLWTTVPTSLTVFRGRRIYNTSTVSYYD